MSSARAGFGESAKEHGLGESDSSSNRSGGMASESQTGDCTASELACRLKPPATDLPRNDSKLGDPIAPSRSCIMTLLFCVCALVVTAVAVRVGPTLVDEISQLWKDPIGLDITERHDEMPTTHYFTHSEEKVSMLEDALDHVIPAKSPGLKSLAEILRKRIREGNTSALATHRLLTEEIPSSCNGTWSTSAESKAKVQSLKHRVKQLYHQVGHPAARLRDALNITQKIRLVVHDEEDATVKAMRESDKEIDQIGRGWNSQIAWLASRSRDSADYTRLQALRKFHEEILMALIGLDTALWKALSFWVAAQWAIENERLMEDVGRLESMVEEGALDEQAAKEILLKVSKVVRKTGNGGVEGWVDSP